MGARESNGSGASEVGVMMGDIKPTRMPRSEISGSNTIRLVGREIVGSRTGSSWGSSPNNSASKGTATGDGLFTINCPNASASTNTVSYISRGQVEARWLLRNSLGVVVMRARARAAVSGMGSGGGRSTCYIIEP